MVLLLNIFLLFVYSRYDEANTLITDYNNLKGRCSVAEQRVKVCDISQPAKPLKSNTGRMSFCWIGIQSTMLYVCIKMHSAYCSFCNFVVMFFFSSAWKIILCVLFILCFSFKKIPVCLFLLLSQPVELQKNNVEEWIFYFMAVHIEYRFNKNSNF